MTTVLSIDTEAARFDPESVFAHPNDIESEPRLTLGRKIATLKRWAADVDRRLAAGSEGMPSNGTATAEADLLQQISHAIGVLEAQVESRASGRAKP